MDNRDFEIFQRQNNQQYNTLYSQIEIDDTTDDLRGIGLEADRIHKKNKKNNKKKVAKKEETWSSIFMSSIRNGIVNAAATVALGMLFNCFRKQPNQLLF